LLDLFWHRHVVIISILILFVYITFMKCGVFLFHVLSMQPYPKQIEGFNMQFLLYKPSLSACHGVCNIYFLYAINTVNESWQLQQKFRLLACQRNLFALPGTHIFQKWFQKFFHISTCSISEHTSDEWDDIYHTFHTKTTVVAITY
jgi:hypothetical protein